MATNTEIKSNNNTLIRVKTTAKSITKGNVADQLDAGIDYTVQEIATVNATISGLPISAKTSGATTLSVTPSVLAYDINSLSFSGGIAYLPTTTVIGKEIMTISNNSGIVIRANVANTAKLFLVFNTFVSSITTAQFEMYRFTYIDFGGYWKAELI